MTAINPVSRKTIGMVLAGGKGERLSPLTLSRPKPGVAFGGKYKIIDFVLSNFFNSNIKNVYILTQYKSYQLNKHIRDSWDKWTGWDEHFEAISPETNSEGEEWFKGTADAISHYLRFVEDSDADYVAVFGGDHIYKMDIRQMIDFHSARQADITIASLEVPQAEARRFGVFSVDEQGRVLRYDGLNRLLEVTLPDTTSCSYHYDPENILSGTTETTKKTASKPRKTAASGSAG